MDNAIWLTWENQIRNKSLSSMLGVKLHVFEYDGNRALRYIVCIINTLTLIARKRPNIVFAQNPSILLIYLLLVCRLLFRYKLVCDAHYVGIKSSSGNKMYQAVLDMSNKLVDLVIVTNVEHQRYVRSIGGSAVVCEDPLPDIVSHYAEEIEHAKTIYFICSFDVDEPFNVAFDAARLLAEDNYCFHVTGNYKKVKIDPDEYSYINFLGYIPTDQYYKNLYSCSVVLDLTNNENCLVCGAYEAMVAEKPLVTSNTSSLKNYFTKGTVFTSHSAIEIANAVKRAYQNRDLLKNEIKDWKQDVYNQQNDKKANIYRELGVGTRF